jgi:hypothetical protein
MDRGRKETVWSEFLPCFLLGCGNREAVHRQHSPLRNRQPENHTDLGQNFHLKNSYLHSTCGQRWRDLDPWDSGVG